MPDGGGGSRAPGQPRADGVDAGADAADQSDARAGWRRGACALPRAPPRGWWTQVRDWAGAPLPVDVQARLARADGAAGGARASRSRRSSAQQAAAVHRGGAGECRAPVGATEGRGDDERLGVARRRAGVARVPESAADRRASWGLRRRRTTAGSRGGSKGSVAAGNARLQVDQHSAGVELGALATEQRAHAVVSGALRDGETRAADWDCRGGAQAA